MNNDDALKLANELFRAGKRHDSINFSIPDTEDEIVVSVVRTPKTKVVRLNESTIQFAAASSIATRGAGQVCGACSGTGKI